MSDLQHKGPFLLNTRQTFRSINEDLSFFAESRPGFGWKVCFAVSLMFLAIGAWCAYRTVYLGLGTWGLNNSVGWGMDITNFVWWIGIGHAGTFISAILLILQQGWRTSINRAAEAMTVFSVLCAAFYPVIHLGRSDHVFFSLPYPNTRNLWINVNSPLVWDVFAIITYFTVSMLYWYTGMLPDLALFRDRARKRLRKTVFRILSMGWSGAAYQWEYFRKTSYILALIATPLVISVHTIVSLDFAVSVLPGWHSTIFPALFVTGAIFSGFAMVQALLIVTRKLPGFANYITIRHVVLMNKILLLTSSLLFLAYASEVFFGLYTNDPYEKRVLLGKIAGPLSGIYYPMLICNLLIPQLLWIEKLRTNLRFTLVLSLLVLAGMWLERFVIITGTLTRDYIPGRWTDYLPSATEAGLFIGTLGFFFMAYLVFIKFFPAVSISEVKHDSIQSVCPDDALTITFEEKAGRTELYFMYEKHLIKMLKILKLNRIKIQEIYSPVPIEYEKNLISTGRIRLGQIAVLAGLIGALTGFLLQKFMATNAYPLIFGGKPYFSIPSFVPVMLECTFLFAAVAVTATFLIRARLGMGTRTPIGVRPVTGLLYAVIIDTGLVNGEETRMKVRSIIEKTFPRFQNMSPVEQCN